jgi:hypothetical protein
LPIKRTINFVTADVSGEEYFSIPVKTTLLYLIDYMRYVKIVRALTEQPLKSRRSGIFCHAVLQSYGLAVKALRHKITGIEL